MHPMIAAQAVDPSRQSTPVYLLPRSPEAEAGGRDWSVPVEAPPQMWSVHVGNAFEEPDGRGGTTLRLHMSGCSYRWFHFHRMFGYNWMNKKLDPAFMNAAKGRELLPRLVQVTKHDLIWCLSIDPSMMSMCEEFCLQRQLTY